MQSVTRFSTLFASLLAAVSLANAHGSVLSFESDGKSFVGPIPGQGSDITSPVRQISTLEPLTDVSSAAMACGPGAANSAKAVANVTAGSKVTFGWRSGEDGTPWPHRWGSVMLYAYQCPDGVKATDCTPPTGAEWVLVDAAGFDKQPGTIGADSTGWTQDRFHFGQTVAASIPAGLPNGDYLLRHEIIALHKGNQLGGAEYYVSCTQARISGGSSGRTESIGAERVAIPGVYARNDPGILVNVFDSSLNADNYKMPGPKVFTATGSGNGGATNNAPAPTSSGNGSQTGAPKPTSTGTGSCKRRTKKRSHRKRTLRKRHHARAVAAAHGMPMRGVPSRISSSQF